MELLFGMMILVMTVSMAVIQYVRNTKYPSMADEKSRISPWILLSASVVMIADMCVAEVDTLRLGADLLCPLACFIFLTSSLWNKTVVRRTVWALMACELIPALLHLSCLAGFLPPLGAGVFLVMHVAVLTLISVQLVAGIWRRMSSVKQVMKSGTIWTNVTLSVDAVYPIMLQVPFVIYLLVSCLSGSFHGVHSLMVFLVYGLALGALAFRIYSDSVFVMCQDRERTIVESMKVTSVESALDVSKIDDVYKDVYERVIAYFENEKPFLDNNLTINEVVTALYSNKLYISRAISQFTGRNFCQFVNYYRVMYSMECFRQNPDLKIHELASMSGFNSIVSYNMAFRLFMGENPSEWSRKERTRLVKSKK